MGTCSVIRGGERGKVKLTGKRIALWLHEAVPWNCVVSLLSFFGCGLCRSGFGGGDFGFLFLDVEFLHGQFDEQIQIRFADEKRKVIPGFDYEDCTVFSGDSVAHRITWKQKSLEDLTGQTIRFEFFLRDADLYTFRATGAGNGNPLTE